MQMNIASRLKRIGLLALVGTTGVSASVCAQKTCSEAAIKTSAAISVNNSNSLADYKLTSEQIDSIHTILKYGMMSTIVGDETDVFSQLQVERQITLDYPNAEINTAKSYLISNNKMARRDIVTKKLYEVDVSLVDDYDDYIDSINGIISPELNKKYSNGDAKSAFKNLVAKLSSKVSGCPLIKETNRKSAQTQLNSLVSKYSKLSKRSSKYSEYVKQAQTIALKYYSNYNVADTDYAKKCNFLMNLCKVIHGTKNSRAIVATVLPKRTGESHSTTTTDFWNGPLVEKVPGWWDTSALVGDANFTGDFHYYVSPNVYELYLTELLNDGIIYEDELNEDTMSSFVKGYHSDFKNSKWHPSNGILSWGADGGGSCALGVGYQYDAGSKSYVSKSVNVFDNENITRLDVLEYVEDYMRKTEKNMTDAEAEIIRYKFGLTFLQQYSESKQKTLGYLTAKGILNWEDEAEYEDLTAPASNAYTYKILYRLANEGARFDFSVVNLTDDDQWWQERGYQEDKMIATELQSNDAMEVEGVNEVASGAEASTATGQHFWDTVLAAATSKYTVTLTLDPKIDWKCNGKKISSVANSSNGKSGNIEVSSVTKKIGKKSVSMYEVKITVEASSASAAIKKATKNITAIADKSKATQCMTKVESDSVSYTMISQSELRIAFPEIAIVEDKVLVNTTTNTQAVLLPDQGFAFVGNTIIRSNEFIMSSGTTDPYYNVAVIASLLNNASFKSLGCVPAVYKTPSAFGSSRVPYSISTSEKDVQQVNVGSLKTTKAMAKYYGNFADGAEQGAKTDWFKYDDIAKGLSTMKRTFAVKTGSEYKEITLVVDWNLQMPNIEGLKLDDNLQSLSSKEGKVRNSSAAEISNALYERPTGDTVLSACWDVNHIISNALANLMYGTEQIEYVKTGWLTPSISVLYKKKQLSSTADAENCLVEIFNKMNFMAYEGKCSEKFNGEGSALSFFQSTWWKSYYNCGHEFNGSTVWFNESSVTSRYDGFSNDADLQNDLEDVTAGREINFYGGVEEADLGIYLYGADFFTTKAGVLYRNIESLPKVEAKYASTGKIKKLFIKANGSQVTNLRKGSIIVTTDKNDKKKELVYLGTEKIGDEEYYRVAPVAVDYAKGNRGMASNTVVDTEADNLFNAGFISVPVPAYKKDNAKQYPLFWLEPTPYASKDKYQYTLNKNNFSDSVWRKNSWYQSYSAWFDTYLSGLEVDIPSMVKKAEGVTKIKDVYSTWAKAQSYAYVHSSDVSYIRTAWKNRVSRVKDAGDRNAAWYSYYNALLYTAPKHDSNGKINKVNTSDFLTKDKSSNKLVWTKSGLSKFASIPGEQKGSYTEVKVKSKSTGFEQWSSGTNEDVGAANFINADPTSDRFKTDYDGLLDGCYEVKSKETTKAKKVLSLPTNRFKKLNASHVSSRSQNVFAIPVFYLNAEDVMISQVNQDGEPTHILEDNNLGVLGLGEYYYPSIIEAVQESIIAHYVKTTTLSELNPGDELTICGIHLTVTGKKDGNNVWVDSYPINGAGAYPKLVKAAKKFRKSEKSRAQFVMEANKLFKDQSIYIDNKRYSFVDFIQNLNLKNTNAKYGIQLSGLKKSSLTSSLGYVYKKAETAYGYKKGKETKLKKVNKQSYSTTAIQLLLSGSVKVRPINAEKTLYTLSCYSDTGVIGYNANNLPFFDESLSLLDNQYQSTSIMTLGHSLSSAFYEIKKDFLKKWNKLFIGDLRAWLLFVVAIVAMYIMVISWLCYLVLHYGTMRAFFDTIAVGPGGDSRYGFDLLKFLSFRLYNLNTNPPLVRVVFIQLACAIIAAIAYLNM